VARAYQIEVHGGCGALPDASVAFTVNRMKRRVKQVSAFEGYQRWAASYDSTPNPVVAMDQRQTMSFLAPLRGEAVLDAGCGTGHSLARIAAAGARPVGLDFSVEMLKVARRRLPAAGLVAADLERTLPLRSRRFDAALCALVGEHLPRLRATFAELRRVLRPGGRFVFSVYHPTMAAAGVEANFREGSTEYRLGAVKYTADDYLSFMGDAGFANATLHEFVGDSELAAGVPDGGKYLGQPLLLVITATG
jgi:ubiquinone/menaquinone biosynthesis C-methylase UbiE